MVPILKCVQNRMHYVDLSNPVINESLSETSPTRQKAYGLHLHASLSDFKSLPATLEMNMLKCNFGKQLQSLKWAFFPLFVCIESSLVLQMQNNTKCVTVGEPYLFHVRTPFQLTTLNVRTNSSPFSALK